MSKRVTEVCGGTNHTETRSMDTPAFRQYVLQRYPDVRMCGAVIHWKQIAGMLVWTERDGYEGRCSACGKTVFQQDSPVREQHCFGLVFNA